VASGTHEGKVNSLKSKSQGELLDMEEMQEKIWKMRLDAVKRQEAVDSFCDACAALSARELRKVERFLQRHANPKTGAKAATRELWTKNEMRACYNELRNISPKVANAWRRCVSEQLEIGLSGYYVRLVFQVLADSLECRMCYGSHRRRGFID
jgi:hypothetical protein